MTWGELEVGDTVMHPHGGVCVLVRKNGTERCWLYLDVGYTARLIVGDDMLYTNDIAGSFDDDLGEWELVQ